jgi:hypothetical protein
MERLAGERLVDGSDLVRYYGGTIDDLLDDEGLVDRAKAEAAVDQLIGERPHLAHRPRGARPDRSQGARGDIQGGGLSFSDVLRAGRIDASQL